MTEATGIGASARTKAKAHQKRWFKLSLKPITSAISLLLSPNSVMMCASIVHPQQRPSSKVKPLLVTSIRMNALTCPTYMPK